MRCTHPVLVFDQTLVVATNGDKEEQTVDILKAVNPLLALRTLSANIKHSVRELAEIEYRFCDAGGTESGAQEILVVGNITISPNSINILYKASFCQSRTASIPPSLPTMRDCRGARIRCLLRWPSSHHCLAKDS